MLLGRLIRFGIAGGCVSLLHIVVAVSLVESGMAGAAMANGTAFTIAALTSFLINARFTFHANLASTAFLRFMLVTLVCGGLSVGLAPCGVGGPRLSHWNRGRCGRCAAHILSAP